MCTDLMPQLDGDEWEVIVSDEELEYNLQNDLPNAIYYGFSI